MPKYKKPSRLRVNLPFKRYIFLFAFVTVTYYTLLRPSDEYLELEEVELNPLRANEDPATKPHFQRRIVAVGDLHGDLPNALKVLKMTGVLDEAGQWSGNVDYLAQTGDIIDRGDDTIPLFRLMEQLRVQAKAKGGEILSNMGNHEWMNVIGDWRYVYDSEVKTFGGVAERQKALSTGWLGSAWAQNYTVTTRLPLHPRLGPPNTDYVSISGPSDKLSHSALSFVHGGLAPTFPFLTPYPSSINSIGASLLKKLQHRPQPPPHPPNPYPGLPPDATVAEQYLYAGEGPLWYRGWALDDEVQVCSKIDEVLSRTGVKRLIMGHTPTFTNIVSRCDGKVIIIDTGISHAYGGVLSALSITYSLYELDAPSGEKLDKENRRWLETEEVAAVYEESKKVLIQESRHLTGDYGVYSS